MTLHVALCAVGFALLYFGADWLVRGSSSLARSFHVAPVVIGLTVVAFGTSAPELVVSLLASLGGKSMIAVGNVVGSNVCNIALVLGLCAVFQPIVCHRTVTRRDIPVMLGVSLAAGALCLDDGLSRADGALLVAGIVAYTLVNYRLALTERETQRALAAEAEEAGQGMASSSRAVMLGLIVAGIAGVLLGARLVVDSAEAIMRALGVGEKFIGLTVVAFGTSLPELATSVVAALRRELDISVGNLVGSNVFNLLMVLGAAALVRPIPIPGGFIGSGLWIDYAVMLGVSVLPLLFMLGGRPLARPAGLALVACYLGYVGWLAAGI